MLDGLACLKNGTLEKIEAKSRGRTSANGEIKLIDLYKDSVYEVLNMLVNSFEKMELKFIALESKQILMKGEDLLSMDEVDAMLEKQKKEEE